MMKIIIHDTPPSTQHIYAPNGKGGLYLKDPKMKLYWMNQIKRQWNEKPIKTPLSVIIEFIFTDKRRRDLDNYLKIILDSCNKVVWNDDSQIVELILRKSIGAKAKTEIHVL